MLYKTRIGYVWEALRAVSSSKHMPKYISSSLDHLWDLRILRVPETESIVAYRLHYFPNSASVLTRTKNLHSATILQQFQFTIRCRTFAEIESPTWPRNTQLPESYSRGRGQGLLVPGRFQTASWKRRFDTARGGSGQRVAHRARQDVQAHAQFIMQLEPRMVALGFMAAGESTVRRRATEAGKRGRRKAGG